MTTQDDALGNELNPLLLRSPAHGGNVIRYQEADNNLLNLARWSGDWSPRVYLRNEVTWYHGGAWIASSDTTDTPGAGTDWAPLVGPMGRGGMRIVTPIAKPDLGAGWIASAPYEEFIPGGVEGVTLDLATGRFSFLFDGLWMLLFSLALDHDSTNHGRFTNIRIFNVTDGTQVGLAEKISIGRDVGSSVVNVTLLVPVAGGVNGKLLEVEIGGGDNVNDVVFTTSILSFVQVQYV